MTDQISMDEVQSLIQLVRSRPNTPINFQTENHTPSAPPIQPPSYFKESKALLSQIEDNSSSEKNSVSFRSDDVKLLISDIKRCKINVESLIENQQTIYKCLLKTKQNVNGNGNGISMNKKSSEKQIICQSFVNIFFYLTILAFMAYHLFFQVKSYCYGK